MTNVQNYVAAQVHDFSGLYLGVLNGPAGLGRLLLCVAALLALAVLAAGAATICLMLMMPSSHPEPEVHAAAVLGLYILFGMATVIIARTRYELGDGVTERHAMQYSWAFAIVAFILVSWLAERYRRYAYSAIVAALVGFAVLKFQDVRQLYNVGHAGFAAAEGALHGTVRSGQGIKGIGNGPLPILYARDAAIRDALAALPKDAVIFTNFHDLLRVRLGVAARYVSDEEIAGGATKLHDFANAIGQRRRTYVVVLLSPRLLDIAGQDWQAFVAEHLGSAFVPIERGNAFVIAEWRQRLSGG